MPGRSIACFGFVLTIVLWMTWPLATRLDSTTTPGFESSKTILLLNEWTVGWNADRAAAGCRRYWTAPHFFPDEQSFALSEPILTSQVVAPLVWLTGTPVLAYNVFLLGSLFLNGWVTWWVLVTRGCGWTLAMIGSWSMIGLPFVSEQLGVLQSVPLAGILATIHFTAAALETGRHRSFLGAGLSLGLTYWTCTHYGLFLSMLLPVCVCLTHGIQLLTRETTSNLLTPSEPKYVTSQLKNSWSRISSCSKVEDLGQVENLPHVFQQAVSPRTVTTVRGLTPLGSPGCLVGCLLGKLALSVGVAGVMIGPIAVAQSRALSNPAYERPRDSIHELSALPSDYLATPFPELLQFVGLANWHDPARWALSPGLWKSLLAVAGMCVGLRSVRRRSWSLFLTVLTLGAFIASLGLNLRLAGWCPYESLLDWVPGLAKVRAPGRFVVFVQIGVVLLSMEALQFLLRWSTVCWQRSQRKPRTRLMVVAVWLAGLLAGGEVRLPAIRLFRIPDVEAQQGWIGWLTDHTPRDAVIAHLPFPAGKSANDYESEAWAMYWSLFHGRRLVNGYSGFFTPSYLKLKAQAQRFPDEDSVAALRHSGAGHCVIPRTFAQSRHLETDRLVLQNLELLFRDEVAGVLVFGWRPISEKSPSCDP